MTDEQVHDGLSRDSLIRILTVCQKLAIAIDTAELLEEIVQAGKDILAADRGSLWVFDQASNHLELRVPAGGPPIRVAAGQGLVGQCLANRAIINVKDAYADERFNSSIDLRTGYRTRSILSIPLLGRHSEPVGVMQLLNKVGGPFDEHDEMAASALASQCAVALQRAQMTEALVAKERLEEEMSVARAIQLGTLPAVIPELDEYELHGEFLPTDMTGGDLFDLVMLDGKLFILMGDATGHGFGAALSATQMQAMLRVAFRCGAMLGEAYRHVNNQLAEDLPDDRFLTAFMGFLDPGTHELSYYSGGQGPLLHYHVGTGQCEWKNPTHHPVGILPLENIGEMQSMSVAPGDIIALLSDGIYEYTNIRNEQFGEERVGRLITDNHQLPMKELSNLLLRAVRDFGEGAPQADDMTIVLIHRH